MLAAAVGSALDIPRSHGHMIVDLGKGIVEAVVMVQGEVVAASSLRPMVAQKMNGLSIISSSVMACF